MASKTNDTAVKEHPGSIRAPVCVTRWPALAHALEERFGPIHVEDELADLVAHVGHTVVIVDTKIHDLDVWPAPLLLNAHARDQLWLFLIANTSDAARLSPALPPRSFFFDRKLRSVDEVAEVIEKESDPDASRKIDSVRFVASADVLVVRMNSGHSFALPLRELSAADDTEVARCSIARDRSYFRVRQESGNVFEVPWDLVRQHSDPTYEHHTRRATTKDDADDDRAKHIGGRVRALRSERNWSAAKLADQAGMKRPNLSRLEAGRHVPSLETLERLADALDVPVVDLVAR